MSGESSKKPIKKGLAIALDDGRHCNGVFLLIEGLPASYIQKVVKRHPKCNVAELRIHAPDQVLIMRENLLRKDYSEIYQRVLAREPLSRDDYQTLQQIRGGK